LFVIYRFMNRITRALLTLFVVAFCSVSSEACRQASREAYVPELGELMTLQQIRYTKLWLAGQAGNWALAAYEVDELGEGFDAVITFHPTHQDSPVAPKDAIPRMITQPLADLRAAVARKDRAAFEQTYDALTAACNNCHKATNYGFNQVQRPGSNPFPSQVFSPPED
jgi:cytochrome c553